MSALSALLAAAGISLQSRRSMFNAMCAFLAAGSGDPADVHAPPSLLMNLSALLSSLEIFAALTVDDIEAPRRVLMHHDFLRSQHAMKVMKVVMHVDRCYLAGESELQCTPVRHIAQHVNRSIRGVQYHAERFAVALRSAGHLSDCLRVLDFGCGSGVLALPSCQRSFLCWKCMGS